ncbi:adenylate kinase family protein [Pedosphaera parvula]|uniref:Adenylate kinase n=1 Tax=Pedosphaera parvula (strain Ellin514) TaxID=320771 RepID=B9XIU8_PEDPL|nr:nucleoside monophosphate kinase [Pedosphaera parvula]EEF60175.1 adenylate kinase [Pedosphaera parvula Ellin514]
MKYRTTLLFGAPGAGKGTQGKILGTIPNFFHCACGDVFRSLKPDSPIGRIFLEYANRGSLVPDKPTVELWEQFIENNKKSGRFNPDTDTLILDGIPRNVAQAEMLKDTLDVRAIFYLRCPNMNKLVERLQRRALRENRLDDASLEVIKHRLKTYERETKPVLNFYGKEMVHKIDSTQTPAKVMFDILRHITKI